MKKLTFLTLLILSVFTFAQKVKMKDGSVTLDKQEIYKYNDDDRVLTISTINTNKEIFVLKFNYYEVPNPFYGTPSCPTSNCSKMNKKSFITFKFLDNGEEFYTDLSSKDAVKNFYKSEMLNEDGSYDSEKRQTFINKYSNPNLEYKLLK